MEADGPTAQPSLASLTAAAERVARAGLRLDGASADLWAALGAVAAEVRWAADVAGTHIIRCSAGRLAPYTQAASMN